MTAPQRPKAKKPGRNGYGARVQPGGEGPGSQPVKKPPTDKVDDEDEGEDEAKATEDLPSS